MVISVIGLTLKLGHKEAQEAQEAQNLPNTFVPLVPLVSFVFLCGPGHIKQKVAR
jgi:hypothetical protein